MKFSVGFLDDFGFTNPLPLTKDAPPAFTELNAIGMGMKVGIRVFRSRRDRIPFPASAPLF